MTPTLLTFGLLLLAQGYDLKMAAGTGEAGFAGDGGPAVEARLHAPFDLAYDALGNIYFSDTLNHRIRRIDARTGVVATIAGTGEPGFDGDGGPAVRAKFQEPYGLALDRQGNIYVADRLNARVRRIDARTGTIRTVAGNGRRAYTGDEGPAVEAGLVEPCDVALDGRGRVYIADVADHRVRLLEIATGQIRTYSGTGRPRHDGDGDRAERASLFGPRAVAVGDDGTVFILEREGNRLRAVDALEGIITTIAGTGEAGYTGDDGPAAKATLRGPKELAADHRGNLFIADTENHVIRRLDGESRVLTTIVGTGESGREGIGGPPTRAGLDRPHGIAVGPEGVLAIGDTGNNRVLTLAPRPPR